MAIYGDRIAAALMYNLQILPESLMCGLIILAIVLANPSIVIVAAGTAGTQLLTKAMGRLVMNFAPDATAVSSSMDACATGFVGKSWDRLLRGTDVPELLWHPKAPSVYMATVGFLAGWGFALSQLYKDEIHAGVVNQKLTVAMTVIVALLFALTLVFRIMTGCDTMLGAFAGAALGTALGYLGAITVGYLSDRRLTNVWGIPLLRDRINSGSAVYICPT
jgi:hypothetical protein